MTESGLQIMVADYLRLQYPDVLFHSDFGSGIKLAMGQAAKQKRQNGGKRAWPDLFIAQPIKTGWFGRVEDGEIESIMCKRCGLFLELKKDGTRLKKKNGEWATRHIKEQAEVLKKLLSPLENLMAGEKWKTVYL